ncbi:MAG: YihY family inner membrane protein [Sulfurospirillaceae bacterium]|nr:YihY family inner membrane protein [Sulfurospirillaceae bacterium]MDD2827589.1 YihY family inner membrane protein [Sulfurospirillaceae bacterium]
MLTLKECGDFFKKLRDDDLAHYASSLSFHTILALIPILLITFSLFTKMPSFNDYYEKVQSFIFGSLIPTQQETMIDYLNQFMENTGNMGAMGLIFVLYISIMFFLDYEKIISKIFQTKTRSLWEALSTYWTMMTLMPLGLVVSFYISARAQEILASSHMTSSINLLLITPYFIIWLLFFIMFTISAKIKIYPKSAFIASFVTSFVWYASKTLFVYYVTYNKTYLSIYGSFSILLFFFLWIYFSWFIYLYGIKLCYILNEEERQTKDTSIS